ncbi:NAD(P)/FAD-dependent oxidoreductase [Dethiothermospora halolimnae]|uniref:NAD(P)/FAD-dependent oxidoreductase n=1 Tax=Dethiothermospora halolimnae TaxID=3114390 RepID=UPI003CCC3986
MIKKVAVIGGGPAGMIAAATASNRGKEVYLFEKNDKLGKKLFITGKGRCNITNNCDIEDLINNVVSNKDFLYSGFYSFTNKNIIDILNRYGVETKVERGNRVFPKSNKSSDVIKALEKYMIDNKVKINLNKEVTQIEKTDKSFIINFKDSTIETFDKVIIATGGVSYKQTGSTGDGYTFAKNFGHEIKEIKPALAPCEIKEAWVKELQGLALKNITVTTYVNGKKVFEDFGEMLFTHFGISGPLVLTMSNYINDYRNNTIKISIDLKPALDDKQLENRIIRDFEKYSRKQFKNSLNDLLPKKIIPIIIKLSEIDEDKFVNQITKTERKNLLNILKNLEMTFDRFRPINEAIVTSGGISVKEINPSTMESKLIKGMYFAGEVIDVDALTGGFNLQIAYSTGYLAGVNC